jgi:hypothetical protein
MSVIYSIPCMYFYYHIYALTPLMMVVSSNCIPYTYELVYHSIDSHVRAGLLT